jgi:drug/metabolite transporter (DMT)-like permease
MDPLTAALVLASAALHPLWYALVKRDPDPNAAFVGLNAVFAAIALGHAALRGAGLPAAAREAWPLLVLSAIGQLVYGLSIVLVLRRGDLSAYYPIIRSSPLAIVAVGFLVLGERYRPVLLAGIALVLAGTFALQYRPGVRLLAEPLNFGLAVLAMLGSTGYALTDARLVRRIDPVAVLFWVQVITVPVYAAVYGRGQPGWRFGLPLRAWAASPGRYALVGVMAYASYYLILLAYARGGDPAAVNAVRQVAIPLSVLIGGVWLAEAAMWHRLGAALAIAAGVVVIVLAR